MSIVNQVRNYLLNEELDIHIYSNYIYVSGFTSIGEIGSELILIRHSKGIFKIRGENLTLSKLYGDEVLIKGVIKEVEFR